jgi:hypothetical protein
MSGETFREQRWRRLRRERLHRAALRRALMRGIREAHRRGHRAARDVEVYASSQPYEPTVVGAFFPSREPWHAELIVVWERPARRLLPPEFSHACMHCHGRGDCNACERGVARWSEGEGVW